MKFSTPFSGAVTAVLLFLASCSASRVAMQVPDALQATTPLPVTGKQGFRYSYQFGEFSTASVHKGWRSTINHSLGKSVGVDATRVRQKSSFVMQPVQGTTWQAQSAYFMSDNDLGISTGPNSRTSVTLKSDEVFRSSIVALNQPVWQLVVENHLGLGRGLQLPAGSFTNGDSVFTVRPIAHLMRRDGQPMRFPTGTPIGYEFVRANGSVVAAVELLGRGRVWLNPTLQPETKGPVVAAVTALLMHQR
ncbi:hypothetical protein LRS06_08320 [Hymenobacter sp. J193]|uniref:hypothetical protein n=1 Tax=Hymenobacter sp. J193 TaxID=2898429 RepID=UPI0021513812|nr:hypothetical protein [Hymenobacter sp. J193]MCR5887781.1 hypothetical protein [Hymenobacter sp. J193]